MKYVKELARIVSIVAGLMMIAYGVEAIRAGGFLHSLSRSRESVIAGVVLVVLGALMLGLTVCQPRTR